MAFQARLTGGPRDGETLALVEVKPMIEVMCEPPGDQPEGFDIHLYSLGERTEYGAIPFHYIGPKK